MNDYCIHPPFHYPQGDWRSWRVAFLVGLLGGGLIAAGIQPSAFDVLPASYTVSRAALGGLLVGLGASMGNGCTSGELNGNLCVL